MKFFDIPAEPRITEMSYPTKVVFGAGALGRVPAQVERLKMKHPLVVTDAGVVKAGLAQKLYDVLKGASIRYSVFDKVEPNPTEKDAFDGVAFFKKSDCDGIIAIGGGSPLDAAKLIQLLTTHEPPLSKYDDATGGDRFVRDDMPPLIAIPTTAGTGSEVSRSGVATLSDTGRKTVIFSPFLLPRRRSAIPS
jgi:alcohol dehydrogenase class IV